MKHLLFFSILSIFCLAKTQSQGLSLHLKNEENLSQSVLNVEHLIVTANGETDSVVTKTSYRLMFKVVESRGEDYLLESCFKQMLLVNVTSEGTYEYKPEKASAYDLLSSIMAKIIDQPFSVRLSKRGKVIEIKELELVIRNAIMNLPENMTSQFEEMFTRWYGSVVLSRNLEIMTLPLPLKTDHDSNNWTLSQHLTFIPNEEINVMYKITDFDADTYHIEGTGTMDKEKHKFGSADSGAKAMSKASFSLSASYNKANGWFINGEVIEHVDGKLKISEIDEINGWIPFEMITKTTISAGE